MDYGQYQKYKYETLIDLYLTLLSIHVPSR